MAQLWVNATRWHYEPDTFRPIAKETPDGELLYIVTDHLGTPREMFSEDGHLQWAAQYRTWGGVKHVFKPDNDNDKTALGYPPNGGGRRGNLAIKYDTVEAQAAQDCPIRFQGQWEDPETGLYYNRYRYYDPLVGQYMSPDPIGLQGGTRHQGYVHNPAVWVDPWGLAAKIAADLPIKDGYTRLYRAVGVDEYAELTKTGQFRLGGPGAEMKQFGLSIEETLKYANTSSSYAAIVSIDVPTNMLSKLGFSKGQIDPFIFRNGVVTIEGQSGLNLLNTIGTQLQHAF